MKNFCQQHTGIINNWNAFLSQKTYTKDELVGARNAANSWITCAVGNLCDIIPRREGGIPKDKMLSSLGIDFAYCIGRMLSNHNNNFFELHRKQALIVLMAIELRSVSIIGLITKYGISQATRMLIHKDAHIVLRVKSTKMRKCRKAKTQRCINIKLAKYSYNENIRGKIQCPIQLV